MDVYRLELVGVYGFDEETWDGETCKSLGFKSLRDSKWLKSTWHVEVVVNVKGSNRLLLDNVGISENAGNTGK